MITLTEKHWNKIEITGPDSCWEWTGSQAPGGYGQVRVKNKLYRVTRIMLAWVDGIEIPDRNVFILHSCDNPPCVNPLHLRWGTHKENVKDALGRKRYKNNFKAGEKHRAAKLKAADVLRIRELYAGGASIRELENEYGVTFQSIWNIVNRKTWVKV